MRRKIAVEKLKSLHDIPLNLSANQDVIARRVNSMFDYLLRKEFSANRNDTDMPPAYQP